MRRTIFRGPQGRAWYGGKIYLGSKIKRMPLQCPIFVDPAMENQGQKWGQCPEILCHAKASSVQSFSSSASLACIPGCSSLLCWGTQASAWTSCVESMRPLVMQLLKPHSLETGFIGAWDECCSRAREKERGRERALSSPGIALAWLWDESGAFSKQPINFPSFCGFFDSSTP